MHAAALGAPPAPRDPLPTDLAVVLENEPGEVLFDDPVEHLLVGAVVNQLLAAHNFALGHKKEHVGGRRLLRSPRPGV